MFKDRKPEFDAKIANKLSSSFKCVFKCCILKFIERNYIIDLTFDFWLSCGSFVSETSFSCAIAFDWNNLMFDL